MDMALCFSSSHIRIKSRTQRRDVRPRTGCNAGADLQPRQLSHADVDVLFTRNQDQKFVLAEKVDMIADFLFVSAAVQLDDASSKLQRFKVLQDGSWRIFGG